MKVDAILKAKGLCEIAKTEGIDKALRCAFFEGKMSHSCEDLRDAYKYMRWLAVSNGLENDYLFKQAEENFDLWQEAQGGDE